MFSCVLFVFRFQSKNKLKHENTHAMTKNERINNKTS